MAREGAAEHRGSILASHHAAPGSIPGIPKKIQRKKLSMLLRLINAWLEESGQRLENLDRTYLVLASGKLVLQQMAWSHNFHKS